MANSRSLSWIDRERWAGLLAKATEALPAAPRSPIPLPPLPPLPPVASPPVAKVAAGYPLFEASSQNLEERLQALVAWIEDCVPCHAAFIADDNGLPVVEHLAAEPGQIAAASSILQMLAQVRSLVRDSGGWLSLRLEDAILHVVEIATPWGRFAIGVVTDDSLPRELLTTLSAAARRSFHGAPSPGVLS